MAIAERGGHSASMSAKAWSRQLSWANKLFIFARKEWWREMANNKHSDDTRKKALEALGRMNLFFTRHYRKDNDNLEKACDDIETIRTALTAGGVE